VSNPSTAHIRALLHDHSGFIASRLAAFVGRTRELAAVCTEIDALLPTGGYLIISGDPGQGKSSLIARLLSEYPLDQTVHHFIPLRPGPDHHVGMLHDVLAQLILTHGLPSAYVATTSRAALRDYFAQALRTLSAAGRHQLIIIDGLDQLATDADGERDLSFLPIVPPLGIVFVLGTRPHDTLRPMELRTPARAYWLPPLSRADFDLVLRHRQVGNLDPALVDRFYAAMEGNALYLDLVACELARPDVLPPDELIALLLNRPGHLFALKLNRLRRSRSRWRTQLRPILGLLLVARDPLSAAALGDLLGLTVAECAAALADLGDLLARDGRERYSFFHLRLVDFLRQDTNQPEYFFGPADERTSHQRLADWCMIGGAAQIWQPTDVALQDEQRAYARQYVVAHMAAAEDYEHLWHLLDHDDYRQAQMHVDPSGRSALRDLDAARDAVIAAGGQDRARSIALLPRLYRYSLRRGRIASHADDLPAELVVLMVRVGRQPEAINSAELLSDPLHKSVVLLQIAQALRQSDQPAAATQMIARAQILLGTLWCESPQHLAEQLQDEENDDAETLLEVLLRGDAEMIEALCPVALQPFYPHVLAADTADLLRLIRIGLLVLRALVRTGNHLDIQASDLRDRWPDASRIIRTQRDWTVVCTALAHLDDSAQVIEQIVALINDLQTFEFRLVLRTLAAQVLMEHGQHEAGEALLQTMLDQITRRMRLTDDDDVFSEISQTLVQIGRHELLLGKLSTSYTLDDRLRRQAATALLESGAYAAALALIHLLRNDITRCDMLLDAAAALARAGERAQVPAIYDEVLDTSILIPAQGTRSDMLLRMAELCLAQGDDATALVAVRWIEGKKPLIMSGGGQPTWPAWRKKTPPPSTGLRGALHYHGALLALARRVSKANQPTLGADMCAEVLALVPKLRADMRPDALWETLDVLTELPPDAVVLGMAREAQAIVTRITDPTWREPLHMALANVYWLQDDLAAAESLVAQITNPARRAEADLWLALIDAQRLADAPILAARITDTQRRAKIQHELTQLLITRGRVAAAEGLAAQIADPWTRGVAQRDLLRALITTNQLAQAEILTTQIDEPRQHASAQCDLVKGLIAVGQIAEAESLIAQMSDQHHQAAAQFELVGALSATDQIHAATALIAHMAAGRWRHRAQLELAQHLVDRQRFTEALEIVRSVDDTDRDGEPRASRGDRGKPIANAGSKATALRIIIRLQIRLGRLTEARAALALIEARDDRAALRLVLAAALVAANQFPPAAELVATALAEERATEDGVPFTTVRTSTIEHLACRGHLHLALALARLITTPFIRVRVLCSLATELRRAGDDAAATSARNEAVALAQKIDDTRTWEVVELDYICDLVEQGRIAEAFDLARSEPRVAKAELPPDEEDVLNRRTGRFLELAQALFRHGATTEAAASIAEAAALMLPVATRRIADQPLRRAGALLAELQRGAEALVLARAIADHLLRAETLFSLVPSVPAAMATGLFHEVLAACTEERSQKERAEHLCLAVAEQMISRAQFDTALTALDWADHEPLPLELVVNYPLLGSGSLIDLSSAVHAIHAQHPLKRSADAQLSAIGYRLSAIFTPADKHRLRRQLIWALIGQGRTTEAQRLLVGVKGYRQQITEQGVFVLALVAQGHAPAAVAFAAGSTDTNPRSDLLLRVLVEFPQGAIDTADEDQRSNLLLTIGEALATRGEMAAAGTLVDGLAAVTGFRNQERLMALQVRVGRLSLTELRTMMHRIPLVMHPATAQILAENGYPNEARELLNAPAQNRVFSSDAHVAAHLAVAQTCADQGHLDAALTVLDSMPKQITHDPIRHPPLAFGTLVGLHDRPIATAQNRESALAALARILANQWQTAQALVTISRIADPGLQVDVLSEIIPTLIARGKRKAALKYVRALMTAASPLDAEAAIDAVLHASQFLVQMNQFKRAADAAAAALTHGERYVSDPQRRATQQVTIVEVLLASRYLKDALAVAQRIDDVDTRVSALLTVAAAAPPRNWAQLNALVQRSWRSAQTYADVIAMLPLAHQLIAEQPTLGDELVAVIAHAG